MIIDYAHAQKDASLLILTAQCALFNALSGYAIALAPIYEHILKYTSIL